MVALIICAACSGDESKEPIRPRFAQTPTVVRLNQTENEIQWVMEPGKTYTLHWSRARISAASRPRIEKVASPFVHQVGSTDGTIYYSLSDADTSPGPQGFSAYFEQRDLLRGGLLALADIDGDGCTDVLGVLGDCLGNFTAFSDAELGLGSLLASGRNYRDARLADLNGDGVLDLVSNSYNQFLPGAPPAQLHFGIGGGRFEADPAFEDLGAAGYGETIVFADFDNDSDVDVFIPYYSYESADEHSWLLLNDGSGKFVDVADEVGVALRGVSIGLRPEGAQAVDIDFDGDIDLAVASKLFLNQRVETGAMDFVEAAFPVGFDEGLQIIDWNNDGVFDVITQYPYSNVGPQLFQSDGKEFKQIVDAFPLSRHHFAYGLNSYDVNGDGRIDVLSSGGRVMGDTLPHYPKLFINTPSGFRIQEYAKFEVYDTNDISAFADFDGSGTIDIVTRFATNRVLLNLARSTNVLRIRLLSENGEQNQFGRVVRISSDVDPTVILARVVDSGSGYLANNQYQLLVSLPLAGAYTIEAFFRDRVVRVPNVALGNSIDIHETGRVVRRPGRAR